MTFTTILSLILGIYPGTLSAVFFGRKARTSTDDDSGNPSLSQGGKEHSKDLEIETFFGFFISKLTKI